MRRFSPVPVVLVLAVAACGGDGGSESPGEPTTIDSPTDGTDPSTTLASTPDTTAEASGSSNSLPSTACDLVTDEEVSVYLGVDVTGEPSALSAAGNPLVDDCLWQHEETFETFSIQYFGDRQVSGSEFEEFFSWETYGGVGDDAFVLLDDDERLNSLWVTTGPYIVVCYPELATDVVVDVDGEGWDEFLPLCQEAVANAKG